MAAHFTFPPAVHKSSSFSISLPTLVIFCFFFFFFNSSHLNRCEVVVFTLLKTFSAWLLRQAQGVDVEFLGTDNRLPGGARDPVTC